jgi:hypothetical protein
VLQCAFARRVADRFVSVELVGGCSVAEDRDEPAGEVEGVL